MRNEPSAMVVFLIKSLINLNYQDYEIVIADNSDIILENGSINDDLIEIVEFAEKHGVRIVRRDCGLCASDLTAIVLPASLSGTGVKGVIHGGKAGNLNAVIETANKQYGWFFILDSDSLLPEFTLRQMISVGIQAGSSKRHVGFVQSILSSCNPNETLLSNAQSVIDEIYYKNYFKAKAGVGVVSNWGHGVLVSREAWLATNGFPLEISEDLAWANELHLLGQFENYYAFCQTLESKPATWEAFKIQRNRWAKGTTILLRKQLLRLWRSDQLMWHEKMDLTYDMTSYIFNAIGCLLPLFFLCSSILGSENRLFFQTLVPAFYLVMAMDNLLAPLEAVRMVCKGNISSAIHKLKAVPYISVYLGAIASQIFLAVLSAVFSKNAIFHVTPKNNCSQEGSFLNAFFQNKMCYLFCLINGWIAICAWQVNPAIVPLLMLSPIGYFFAPLIGLKWNNVEKLRSSRTV